MSLWSFTGFSAPFFKTLQEEYFEPSQPQIIGIEVEIGGLRVNKVADLLRKSLNGKIVGVERIESQKDLETGRIEHFRVKEKELRESLIGTIVIKPEDNGTDDSHLVDNYKHTRLVEIVTSPIDFESVILFQGAIEKIEDSGALGTDAGLAISTQVNVEMGGGERENIHVTDILNILRNYLKSDHRKMITKELKVPEQRKKYLGLFSPGMMERISDRKYKPEWETFFFDFMYRQSLEVIGFKNAWEIADDEGRALLKDHLTQNGFKDILPVIKWNYIRVSSLMMFMFPEDWLSQYLKDTTWFHAYPILEFRESNTDFQVASRTMKILGLVYASLDEGEFEFKKLGILPARKCSSYLH